MVIKKMMAVSILAAGWAPMVMAGESPTAEERAKIEAVLRSHGFSRWGEIEREDDSAWEVEHAYASDGEKYELKLRRGTLEIINREKE
jgi:Peptidase propeptide and YPEB domain